MDFSLWSRTAVGQLIEPEFGIRLQVRSTRKYLARRGFTRRWCTEAWRTGLASGSSGLRRCHRAADGVGPCGIKHAIENHRADHGFGAPCGIAARAQPLTDEPLVAAHRGLNQRARCRLR